jgi:hypothetical protein
MDAAARCRGFANLHHRVLEYLLLLVLVEERQIDDCVDQRRDVANLELLHDRRRVAVVPSPIDELMQLVERDHHGEEVAPFIKRLVLPLDIAQELLLADKPVPIGVHLIEQALPLGEPPAVRPVRLCHLRELEHLAESQLSVVVLVQDSHQIYGQLLVQRRQRQHADATIALLR